MKPHLSPSVFDLPFGCHVIAFLTFFTSMLPMARAECGAPPWVFGPTNVAIVGDSPTTLQFQIGDYDSALQWRYMEVSSSDTNLIPNAPENLRLSPVDIPQGTNGVATVTVVPVANRVGDAGFYLKVADECQVTSFFCAVKIIAPENIRPARRILGWWPGDGDAHDSVGLHDAKLMNGAGFGQGTLAQAFALDGEDDYVELPCPPPTGGGGFAHSVETWIHPTRMADGKMVIFSKGAPGVPPRAELSLVPDGQGQMILSVMVDLMTNSVSFSGHTPVPVNEWSHVALVLGYDPVLYLNGEEEAVLSDVLWTYGIYGDSWWLAKGEGAPFQGRIDEFAWYETRLTPEEIKTICRIGKTGESCPPFFIRQPEQLFSGLGSTVRFSVGVANVGGLPLTYQWQFNSTDLVGQTNATLVLTGLRLNQSGSYRVRVQSPLGEIVSAHGSLKVSGVMAWGTVNYQGQQDVPQDLMGVVSIAAASAKSIALTEDGTLFSWGGVHDGVVTRRLEGGGSNVRSIATTGSSTYVVNSQGNVDVFDNRLPEVLGAEMTNVVSVSANYLQRIALRADGTVVCWPFSWVPTDLTNAVAVSASARNDCYLALRQDGTVLAWDARESVLLPVPPGLSNVVAIAAGSCQSLALRADGSVVSWGEGLPHWDWLTNVPPQATNVVAIAGGSEFSLALRADGSVVQWGDASVGWPTKILDYPNAVAIAAGGYHALVLLREGAPQMAVEPWDKRVFPGTSPTFVGKAVGKQSMTYQWSFNDQPIPGATNDAYTVSAATILNEGLYSVSASNELGVVSSRKAKLRVLSAPSTNQAPVLDLPDSWVIEEGTFAEPAIFEFKVTGHDPDNSPAGLSFKLGAGAPSTASISADGDFRWVLNELMGPGNYPITFVVNDGLSSTEKTVSATVTEVNCRPVFSSPLIRTINGRGEFTCTNEVLDYDIPANHLSHVLVYGPEGAYMDSLGEIHWTPTRLQAPSTNLFVTSVTDDGVPALSATNAFWLIVLAPRLPPVDDLVVNPGQLVCFTNLAFHNDPSRRLAYSLEHGPGAASVGALDGVFTWRPPLAAAGSSNWVEIAVTDNNLPPVSDTQGFAIKVNALQPVKVLPLGFANDGFALEVTGPVGPDYIVQTSADLDAWADLETLTPSEATWIFTDQVESASRPRYYRVRLAP